jgi:WD40 repeat protein
LLLDDVHRFLLAHHHTLASAASHVYFSALLFTPKKTILYKTYDNEATTLVKVMKGGPSTWPSLLLIFQGHESDINSIAFSPDGCILTSCSDDCTVRLWNVKNGDAVTTLEGHSDAVSSVTFC